MTKYNNHKIVNQDGEFDSKLEYLRFCFLRDAQNKGEIRGLKRQVEYELIPKQTRPELVKLKTKTKVADRIVERACRYRADFQYEMPCEVCRRGKMVPSWKLVVEDTKGGTFSHGHFTTQTPDFIIKRKLMLYVHDIELRIVTKATEEIWTEKQ